MTKISKIFHFTYLHLQTNFYSQSSWKQKRM